MTVVRLALMCSLALGAAMGSAPALARPVDRAKQVGDILEATYRYMFEHNASVLQQRAHVFCLSLGVGEKRDPPATLMKRFAGHLPSVTKVSECADAPDGVLDASTRGKGLIFSIAVIEWKNDTEVAVSGGYYEGGLSSSSNLYFLSKRRGIWTVTKDKLGSISRAGSRVSFAMSWMFVAGDLQIQVGRERIPVRARVAEGEGYSRLWAGADEVNQGQYATYQSRTSRAIPVVVLEPR